VTYCLSMYWSISYSVAQCLQSQTTISLSYWVSCHTSGAWIIIYDYYRQQQHYNTSQCRICPPMLQCLLRHNFRHLGFVKFKFLTVGKVKRPILHQRTKFRKDWSNRCRDLAIYVIFRMAAADILDFRKLKILTVDPLPGANMRHHAKLHQNQSNCCRDIAI